MNSRWRWWLLVWRAGVAQSLVAIVMASAWAEERTEHFDKDPGWESRNSRAEVPHPREIKQDFGYSATSHAGGKAGEVGGWISPAAEPAYYATKIDPADFNSPLAASGTFTAGNGPFHVLLGFFNASTLNEWRTPNTIAIRLSGRGERVFAFVEYATARWRAGGDHPRAFPTAIAVGGREELKGFASGRPHRWSLRYDPHGNEGQGVVTATIDDETAICNLSPGHKQDGASFNRFGLMTVMKSADTGGELWIDDVEVNGRQFDFEGDPGWEGKGNRTTYTTTNVRPRFDFGFSNTQFAGGQKAGEFGGLVFRGDCRYPEKMASYADHLEPLALSKPMRAGGKIALRRGVSDSGVLIGFFDSSRAMQSNPSQDSGLPRGFLGISTDGPSREGFYFAPTYRFGEHGRGSPPDAEPPHIYPDGTTHDWSLEYSSTDAAGRGRIKVTLDGQKVSLTLAEGHKSLPDRFDRFGIVTTWVDGNGQTLYLDDVTYTYRQD